MKPKPKKPKKLRNNEKYPALTKNKMPRVRQEYLDFEYIDQLNDEEKAWLNKFNDEYLNASFKHDDTDIQSYEKYGKDANDRNNSRNRCLYGQLKNKADKFNNKKLLNYDNLLGDVENSYNSEINPKNLENAYIDFIELKEIEEFFKEYDEAMLRFNEDDE